MLAEMALAVALSISPVKPVCPAGLVCFTPQEVAEIQTRLIDLEVKWKVAEGRVKRLGTCVGVGGGYSLSADEGEFTVGPSVGAFVVYGLRLPF